MDAIFFILITKQFQNYLNVKLLIELLLR